MLLPLLLSHFNYACQDDGAFFQYNAACPSQANYTFYLIQVHSFDTAEFRFSKIPPMSLNTSIH